MSPFPIIFPGGALAVDVIGARFQRNSDLVGNADGKKFILSAWIKSRDSGIVNIWTHNGVLFNGFKFGGSFGSPSVTNNFEVQMRSSAGVDLARFHSGVGYADDTWHHVLASGDVGIAGARHLYVNDASDLVVDNFVDGTIDFTGTIHNFAASGMCYAELYINLAEYLDFSVVANRRKFITAGLKPADLGSDGLTPTGIAPLLYMRGGVGEFDVNLGSGGAVNDQVPTSYTDCATDPF